MKRERIIRHFAIAFAFAVLLYVVAFYLLEHARTRKGGWLVTFASDGAGTPTLIVSQPHLGISNVSFAFPDHKIGESNLNATVSFDRPLTNIPFGRVIYFDTTFLPGSVVFDLFGHEIQLLPRVLILNHEEIPWQSGTTLRLSQTNRIPSKPARE